MVSFESLMFWYGVLSLVLIPLLVYIVFESRKIFILIAEAKADDGKIDAQEAAEILQASSVLLQRIVGRAIKLLANLALE